ncbi:MAG TPA: hypothetical protein VHS28_06090, partial [Chloroflexota bacterium]|nr:hypothetical protein [Chloroflexota bacterium]
MKLPSRVKIVEVGPRDGFQAERQWIPTEQKIEIVNALSRTGIKDIQATSFVHPKAVPQLADAEEVMSKIDRPAGVEFRVLVPNMKGLERAIAYKPKRWLRRQRGRRQRGLLPWWARQPWGQRSARPTGWSRRSGRLAPPAWSGRRRRQPT